MPRGRPPRPEPTHKDCAICKKQKPVEEFKVMRTYTRKTDGSTVRHFYSYCRTCDSENSKMQKSGDPEYQREWRWRTKYNLSPEEAKALLASPCDICGDTATVIDHDHETGKVRGGLCAKCNSGLGFFDDRVDLLKAAVKYLKYHQTP